MNDSLPRTHPFFTKEGKLRDGLEFLTEAPKLRPPWEKA
jgi:hypothetical protein